jgi:hypothetical protein
MKLINEHIEQKEEERENQSRENDFNFGGDKSFDERENAPMMNTNMGVIKRF